MYKCISGNNIFIRNKIVTAIYLHMKRNPSSFSFPYSQNVDTELTEYISWFVTGKKPVYFLDILYKSSTLVHSLFKCKNSDVFFIFCYFLLVSA